MLYKKHENDRNQTNQFTIHVFLVYRKFPAVKKVNVHVMFTFRYGHLSACNCKQEVHKNPK